MSARRRRACAAGSNGTTPTEGRADAIAIELPKGAYVPQFRPRDAHDEPRLPPAASTASTRAMSAIWFAAVIVMMVVVAAAFWGRPHATPIPDVAVARFDVELLPGEVLGSEVGTDVIVSPDGTRVVFVAQASTASPASYAQARSGECGRTDGHRRRQGAVLFTRRPVGRFLGGGQTEEDLCRRWTAADSLRRSRSAWRQLGRRRDDRCGAHASPLSRISSSGGAPSVLVDLTGESQAPLWPQVLPGSSAVLFTAIGSAGPNAGTIEALSIPDGHRRVLVRNGTFGRYLANGYLTYVNQGALFAVPFAADRFEVRGSGTPILDDVAYSSTFGFAQMDVSRTGTLVYRRSVAGGRFTVAWIDGAGAIAPMLGRPGHYLWPRLSPDLQRLALTMTESGVDSVWIYDPRRDETTRISGLRGQSGAPLWTRDGEMIVVGGATGLSVVAPRADAKPVPLVQSSTIQVPWSFSPDGRRLAYSEMSASRGFDLWTVPVQKTAAGLVAGRAEPFLQTAAFEVYPSFSPDGQWLAYSSNESGTWEVYVRAFPDNGSKTRVSVNGGRIPRWSSHSHELLYKRIARHSWPCATRFRMARSFEARRENGGTAALAIPVCWPTSMYPLMGAWWH